MDEIERVRRSTVETTAALPVQCRSSLQRTCQLHVWRTLTLHCRQLFWRSHVGAEVTAVAAWAGGGPATTSSSKTTATAAN